MEKVTDLNDEQLEEAKKVLLKSLKFPLRRKHETDDPIPGQVVANISYELLPEPRQGIFGFLTVRGNWQDKDRAYESAVEILKTSDSTRRILQVPVGCKVPITSNPDFFTDTIDVDTEEDDPNSERAAMKRQIHQTIETKKQRAHDQVKARRYLEEVGDVEEEEDKVISDIEKISLESEKRKRREEREYIEQVEKNHQEALEAGKRDDDPESLESYVRARVAERDILVYKLPQLVSKYLSMRDGLLRIQASKKRLEEANPHFEKEWLNLYNDTLEKSGIATYTHAHFEFMDEFVEMLTSFELSKEEFEEKAEKASKLQNTLKEGGKLQNNSL